MNRRLLLPGLAAALLSACGGDSSSLTYTNPEAGVLRLIKRSSDSKSITLDFVVGDKAVTGYSTGFTLPVDTTLVELVSFEPGTALPAGTDPVAAKGTLVTAGPLSGMLVTAQSQKASGAGAVETNAPLQPGTVLFSVKLGVAKDAGEGVAFDGTADGFRLPSGGLRDRIGTTVVTAAEVGIGKLVIAK